jgi:repressor LexA
MALTPKQKNVLDFIASATLREGYCPSYEEIARGVGLSSLATVHKHISTLEQKGYLSRKFNESRSLEVARAYLEAERDRRETLSSTLALPLRGRIAAGRPVEAYETPETLNLGDFIGSPGTFALEVRGDSMIEDHIRDGDFVLVERSAEVRDGDIVVALVQGAETTLKRLYHEPDGRVRLQPANAEMAPVLVPADEVDVQGRVLAVLRKYR